MPVFVVYDGIYWGEICGGFIVVDVHWCNSFASFIRLVGNLNTNPGKNYYSKISFHYNTVFIIDYTNIVENDFTSSKGAKKIMIADQIVRKYYQKYTKYLQSTQSSLANSETVLPSTTNAIQETITTQPSSVIFETVLPSINTGFDNSAMCSNISNSLPNLTGFGEFNRLLENLVNKFKTTNGIDHNFPLNPVVFGSSLYGNVFNEETVSQIEIVTIYDAPSQDAWLSCVAGMGQTSIRDAELAAEYEKIFLYDSNSCFVEVIKTPCDNSFQGVKYNEEDRREWVELLLKQLKLFPKLRIVRILCCSKNAKLLCEKLHISSEKGIRHHSDLYRDVEFIIFTHPSPYLAAFNHDSLEERKKFATTSDISQIDLSIDKQKCLDFFHFFSTSKNHLFFPKLVKNEVIPNKTKQQTSPKQKVFDTMRQLIPLGAYYQNIKQRTYDDQDIMLRKIKEKQIKEEKIKEEQIKEEQVKQDFQEEQINEVDYYDSYEQFVNEETEYFMNTEYNEYIRNRPGNCQYDSILLLINEPNRSLREEVATFISQHANEFSEFIDGYDLAQVLTDIRGDEWGNNLTLVAISHILQKPIRVCFADNHPDYQINEDIYPDGEELVLGYINGNHYVPLFKLNNIPNNAVMNTPTRPPQSQDQKDSSLKFDEDTIKKEKPIQPSLETDLSEIKDGESSELQCVKNEEPNLNMIQNQSQLDKQSLYHSNKVFVDNISYSARPIHLKQVFIENGYKVTRVYIYFKEKKSLGKGYVEFENPKDCDKAIEEMNGIQVKDRKIRIANFKPKKNNHHKKEEKKKQQQTKNKKYFRK